MTHSRGGWTSDSHLPLNPIIIHNEVISDWTNVINTQQPFSVLTVQNNNIARIRLRGVNTAPGVREVSTQHQG